MQWCYDPCLVCSSARSRSESSSFKFAVFGKNGRESEAPSHTVGCPQALADSRRGQVKHVCTSDYVCTKHTTIRRRVAARLV